MSEPTPALGRLLLIRHGKTAGNAVRYVGWEDEPLSDVGYAQAREVALLLQGRRIDAVYASPLSRARETGRPLAEALGIAVDVCEGLKEINYGAYQGRPKDVHPLKIRKAHVHEPMPGGESLSDVQRRLRDVIERLAQHVVAGRTVAVVAHFWTNRILLGTLLGLDLDGMIETLSYKPQNGSVLEVEFTRREESLMASGMTLLTPEGRGDDA